MRAIDALPGQLLLWEEHTDVETVCIVLGVADENKVRILTCEGEILEEFDIFLRSVS